MKGLCPIKIDPISICPDSRQIMDHNFADALDQSLDYINEVVKEELKCHPDFDKKQAETQEKSLRKNWQIQQIFIL